MIRATAGLLHYPGLQFPRIRDTRVEKNMLSNLLSRTIVTDLSTLGLNYIRGNTTIYRNILCVPALERVFAP
jgi:hypothetical protein